MNKITFTAPVAFFSNGNMEIITMSGDQLPSKYNGVTTTKSNTRIKLMEYSELSSTLAKHVDELWKTDCWQYKNYGKDRFYFFVAQNGTLKGVIGKLHSSNPIYRVVKIGWDD